MITRRRAKLEAAAALGAGENGSEKIGGYVTLGTVAEDDSLIGHASKNSSAPAVSEGLPSSVESLCSALDPGPTPDLYFSCDPDKVLQDLLAPRVTLGSRRGREEDAVMKDCVITPDFERRECAPPITTSKHAQKKVAKVIGTQDRVCKEHFLSG